MINEEFRAGQVLSARMLNDILAEVRRLGKVSAVPPLRVGSGASGFHFSFDERRTFPIKITSGGADGKYAWTGQDPVDGGAWADNATSGTLADDPAWEANLNSTIAAGTIVLRAWREPLNNEVRFEHGHC